MPVQSVTVSSSADLVMTYHLGLVNVHDFSNLVPCVAGVFDYQHLFCCSSDAKINCCDKNFTIDWGTSYVYGTSWHPSNTSSNSSSVSASSTSTVTQTQIVRTSPSQTTVGVAVGVPLLVLLLTVLGCVIYRERQWRHRTQVSVTEKDTPDREIPAPQELSNTMVNELPERQLPAQLHD